MTEPVYCFDTNAFLTAWNQTYRPNSFGSFWQRLEGLIDAGRLLICQEVEVELGKKDDDVYAWVKARPSCVIELEEEQISLVRALAREFPMLAKERLGRWRADGFVIALAQWKGLVVVTAENHRGPGKIPNICDVKGIDCITLPDMIERENWQF